MRIRTVTAVVPHVEARSGAGDHSVPARRTFSTGGVDVSDGRALQPRQLDLRRTPAPKPVELPPMRSPHPRRYATAVFDHKGRLTCGMVFDVLDWEAGTPVDIAVRAGVIVVRHADGGAFALNGRRFLHVPARFRRWCSFGERESVVVRAVPESATLLIFGQEWLDRVLPDPGGLVTGGDPGLPGGGGVGSDATVVGDRWRYPRMGRAAVVDGGSRSADVAMAIQLLQHMICGRKT